MVLKLDKRYSSGLTLLSSYVLSKMFADSDSTAIGGGGGRAMDHYNRRLDKGLSYDDQTHVMRQAFTYELPFGKGRHMNLAGVSNCILGGWGLAGVYAGFGNATRDNPKARRPWNLNENITLSMNVDFTEQVRLTLRFEAFNIFNRVRMGNPDSTVTSANFGIIRSQGNDPRRMQFGVKITF